MRLTADPARYSEHPKNLCWAIHRIIEAHEIIVLTLALGVLSTFSLLFARRQPFLLDEYLARITELADSSSAVWHMQATAPLSVDPPLYHFVAAHSLRIFGANEFSARLLPAFSYTLFTFLLYRFVRRYADIYTGLTAVALCMLCGAFSYAYEARQYTWILAADCLALVSWTRIVAESKERYLALFGIFFGTAVTVGSHWLGGLVVIPLAAGEAVRDWQKRRIDPPVWGALLGGALTVLAYIPLLRASSAYRILPWKGVALRDIPDSYSLLLEPCFLPLTLLLVFLSCARFLFGAPGPKLEAVRSPLPVFVSIAVFALFPFLVFVVTKAITHAFQPRYALPCTIGLIPLLSLAVRDFARRSALWVAVAIVIIGGYGTFSHCGQIAAKAHGSDAEMFADAAIFSRYPTLPIASAAQSLFLRLDAHGPQTVRERNVFLTDPSSVRLSHENTNFLMTKALQQWTKLPIVELPTFLSAHTRFYLLQDFGVEQWLMSCLLEHHALVQVEGMYAGHTVYLVDVGRKAEEVGGPACAKGIKLAPASR